MNQDKTFLSIYFNSFSIRGVSHAWAARWSHSVLIYPWVNGELLYQTNNAASISREHPGSTWSRFRRLPLSEVYQAVSALLQAHLAVEQAGFVAVDFYDGSILYDFTTHQLHLCDFDEYRPDPFTVTGKRQPGSRRFMAPEEYHTGAIIDSRTTVFTLGRALRLLCDAGDDEQVWRGTPEQLTVVQRATHSAPFQRYQSITELATAWNHATSN